MACKTSLELPCVGIFLWRCYTFLLAIGDVVQNHHENFTNCIWVIQKSQKSQKSSKNVDVSVLSQYPKFHSQMNPFDTSTVRNKPLIPTLQDLETRQRWSDHEIFMFEFHETWSIIIDLILNFQCSTVETRGSCSPGGVRRPAPSSASGCIISGDPKDLREGKWGQHGLEVPRVSDCEELRGKKWHEN